MRASLAQTASVSLISKSPPVCLSESQRHDGELTRILGARALLLMRGAASALEPLRTPRRDHQRRATRVSLAKIVAQQRRAHEPAHGPSESGARHRAPYTPRAAPSVLTKGQPTGARARAPTHSCTCAKGYRKPISASVRMADPDWKITLDLDSGHSGSRGRLIMIRVLRGISSDLAVHAGIIPPAACRAAAACE